MGTMFDVICFLLVSFCLAPTVATDGKTAAQPELQEELAEKQFQEKLALMRKKWKQEQEPAATRLRTIEKCVQGILENANCVVNGSVPPKEVEITTIESLRSA